MFLSRALLQMLPLIFVAGLPGGQWNGTGSVVPVSQEDLTQPSIRPLSLSHLEVNNKYASIGLPMGVTEISSNQILRRAKRSDGTPQANSANCDNDVTISLSNSAKEVCASTRDIDKYISQVKSVRPVQLSSFNEESYKGLIRDYNLDLSNAQNNYNEWRQGDSIFNSLKETFLAAKNFEPTFNREFENNQRRVNELTQGNTQKVKTIEEDIAELETAIKEGQEAVALVTDSPSEQKVLEFLENQLKENQRELDQLLKDEERVKTVTEINELISFLELVAHKISGIQAKAFKTAVKVEGFQEKTLRDSNTFLRHRKNVQSAIQKLRVQRDTNSNERVRLQNEKKNLETQINQKSQEISRIRTQIQNNENDLRHLEYTISRKEKEARDKQIIGGALLIIPVFGWIAGGTLLGLSVEEEKRLSNTKRQVINQYRGMIDAQQSQIYSLHNGIQNSERRISDLNAEFTRLGNEMNYFIKLDTDLDSIQKDISSILPSVNKALLSIAKMKEIFDGVEQNFNNIIDAAKEGKSKGDEKNLRYFIYYNISALKCKWDKASVQIIGLHECN